MTSSTVCALPSIEKNAMAASKGRKKRITPENSLNGISRNSTFMNSPNPTVCDKNPNGRTKRRTFLLLRRNQQHLVSRLSLCCQEVSLREMCALDAVPELSRLCLEPTQGAGPSAFPIPRQRGEERRLSRRFSISSLHPAPPVLSQNTSRRFFVEKKNHRLPPSCFPRLRLRASSSRASRSR